MRMNGIEEALAREPPGDKRLKMNAQPDLRCGVPVTGVRGNIPSQARASMEKRIRVRYILQNLGQFGRKSALGFMLTLFAAAAVGTVVGSAVGSLFRSGGADRTRTLHYNTLR